MSHVELAYQARNTTDYMIASGGSSRGHGYDCHDWLRRIGASDHSEKAVLSAMVESGEWAYSPGGSYGADDITLALTDIQR